MVGHAAKPGKAASKAAAALALAFILSWHPGAAWAATYPSLTPSPASVNAGSSVTLTLNDSVDIADAIGAIDLQVTFDPSLLSFDTVANGSVLNTAGWATPTFNESSPGVELIGISECDYSILSCGSDLSGSGDLLTLTFDALGGDPTGTTPINVQTNPLDVGTGGDYQLASLSDTIDITGHAVPAPGLACFLLPALALIRIHGRARSRKAA